MAVSQAVAQSKPTMAAVIFLTALVRIPFAGFIGVRSEYHQGHKRTLQETLRKARTPVPK
jgi:hypothetical protein